MKTAFHFIFAALLLLFAQGEANEDEVAECSGWAEAGECTKNPNYMKANCAASCRLQAEEDERTKKVIGEYFISCFLSRFLYST